MHRDYFNNDAICTAVDTVALSSTTGCYEYLNVLPGENQWRYSFFQSLVFHGKLTIARKIYLKIVGIFVFSMGRIYKGLCMFIPGALDFHCVVELFFTPSTLGLRSIARCTGFSIDPDITYVKSMY